MSGVHHEIDNCAAVALLLGLAVATADSKDLSNTSPVAKPVLIAHQTPVAMAVAVADDAMPDAPMPINLYRFALNALLVPLLDDTVPPRWATSAIRQ